MDTTPEPLLPQFTRSQSEPAMRINNPAGAINPYGSYSAESSPPPATVYSSIAKPWAGGLRRRKSQRAMDPYYASYDEPPTTTSAATPKLYMQPTSIPPKSEYLYFGSEEKSFTTFGGPRSQLRRRNLSYASYENSRLYMQPTSIPPLSTGSAPYAYYGAGSSSEVSSPRKGPSVPPPFMSPPNTIGGLLPGSKIQSPSLWHDPKNNFSSWFHGQAGGGSGGASSVKVEKGRCNRAL